MPQMTGRINPFTILGITPQLIRQLNQEQLQQHIVIVFRGLLKFYHTDVGGNRSQVEALTWAKEELSTNLDYWKARYLDKTLVAADFKEQLTFATTYGELLERQLLSYWQASLNITWIDDCLIHHPPFVLLVADTIHTLVIGTINRKATNFSRETVDDKTFRMFELEVTMDGLFRYEVERVIYKPKELDPLQEGLVPGYQWVVKRTMGKSFYWKRNPGTCKQINNELKLIGSLDRNRYPQLPPFQYHLREQLSYKGKLSAENYYQELQAGFTLQQFQVYLPGLVSYLEVYNYMVGLRKDNSQLVLLGHIRGAATKE